VQHVIQPAQAPSLSTRRGIPFAETAKGLLTKQSRHISGAQVLRWKVVSRVEKLAGKCVDVVWIFALARNFRFPETRLTK